MSIARKITESAGSDGGGSGGSGKYVDDVFQTTLTEGLGNETVVNGMDLLDKGALIWQKSRIQSSPHYLYDSERGAGKALSSNTPDGEQDFGSSGVQSWNSDGWTAGSGGPSSGGTTAHWTFAKQKGFFDIVTYTGDGVAGREIPHNLGVEPGMIIIKNRYRSENFIVFHKDLSNPLTKMLFLNSNSSEQNQSTSPQYPAMPTDTKFTVGDDTSVNYASDEYVAYVFAHDDSDESIIKCGTYEGNGNNDGPEIDLGWEPQWLLVKNATAGGTHWVLLDNMRGWTASDAATDAKLYANDNRAESLDRLMGITSTGFFPEGADPKTNQNGSTYVYMAIRRPNKPAEEFEPEELFGLATGTSPSPWFKSGFPVDMAWRRNYESATENRLSARLMQGNVLYTETSNAAMASTSSTFDYPDGWHDNINGSTNSNIASWMFRRAPGFFDVVTYEGANSDLTVGHSLGAVPEMMWVKSRDNDRS